MFKRLFIISGIIAFLLAGAMMWFWYLPMKEMEKQQLEAQQVENQVDTIAVAKTDSIP
jgi:hypothetical protein